MKFVPTFFSLLLLTILPAELSAADAPEVVNVQVPKGDKVAVRLPAGWKHSMEQPSPALPPTLEAGNAAGSVKLMLTFMPDLGGKFGTKEAVDKMVTAANQHYVSGSVEKKLTLTQVESKLGHGSYAKFTDADFVNKPVPAGKFKFVTSGVFVIKKQFATFTVLTNDENGADYKEALKVVGEGISAQ